MTEADEFKRRILDAREQIAAEIRWCRNGEWVANVISNSLCEMFRKTLEQIDNILKGAEHE